MQLWPYVNLLYKHKIGTPLYTKHPPSSNLFAQNYMFRMISKRFKFNNYGKEIIDTMISLGAYRIRKFLEIQDNTSFNMPI